MADLGRFMVQHASSSQLPPITQPSAPISLSTPASQTSTIPTAACVDDEDDDLFDDEDGLPMTQESVGSQPLSEIP